MLSSTPVTRSSHAMASRSIVPAASALFRIRQTHQVRTLWFNSLRRLYLDPEFRKRLENARSVLQDDLRYLGSSRETLRAQERLRSYMEKHRAEAHSRLAAAMYMRMRERRRRCGGAGSTSTEPEPRPDHAHSREPGSAWLPELHNIRRYLDEQRDALASVIKPRSAPESGSDYAIDPITNRKVYKSTGGTKPSLEPETSDSDGLRQADELERSSSFESDADQKSPRLCKPTMKTPEPPAEYDREELDKYRKIDIDYPPSMNEELIHRVEDLPRQRNPNPFPPGGESERPSAASKETSEKSVPGDAFEFPQASAATSKNTPTVTRSTDDFRGPRGQLPGQAGQTDKTTRDGWPRNERSPAWRDEKWSPLSLGSINKSTRSQPRSATKPAKHQPDDPYSKDPQGLELSWAEECKKDPYADKMYVKHYKPGGLSPDPDPVPVSSEANESTASESPGAAKIKPEKSRDMHNSCPDMYGSTEYMLEKELRASQVAKEEENADRNTSSGGKPLSDPSTRYDEPTLYKILAYDSTMQKIDIAETTSIVPDDAKPLSPTDVMVRLSNPSKFFPHFGPLQKEGYEIVSGSGDVLVFRKVRTPAEAPSSGVNPIDMMGRQPLPDSALPNAGNFVSPTGFMSYVEEEPKLGTTNRGSKASSSSPSAAARGGDAAGEAQESGTAATSGSHYARQRTQRNRQYQEHPGRPGFVQRTITGIVWLAGGAYEIGVVSEFAGRPRAEGGGGVDSHTSKNSGSMAKE